MATHTISPMRPARTLCAQLPAPGALDWQGATAPTCRRCARGVANLQRMGAEMVAYWAGSVGASVQRSVDAGLATVIVAGARPPVARYRVQAQEPGAARWALAASADDAAAAAAELRSVERSGRTARIIDRAGALVHLTYGADGGALFVTIP